MSRTDAWGKYFKLKTRNKVSPYAWQSPQTFFHRWVRYEQFHHPSPYFFLSSRQHTFLPSDKYLVQICKNFSLLESFYESLYEDKNPLNMQLYGQYDIIKTVNQHPEGGRCLLHNAMHTSNTFGIILFIYQNKS